MTDRIIRRPSQNETSFKRKIVRPVILTAAGSIGLLALACDPRPPVYFNNPTITGLNRPGAAAEQATPRPSGAGQEPIPATPAGVPAATPTLEEAVQRAIDAREGLSEEQRALNAERRKTNALACDLAKTLQANTAKDIEKLTDKQKSDQPDPCKEEEKPTPAPAAMPVIPGANTVHRPETGQQSDWTQRPILSETIVPNDGTRNINRVLGPNQIIAISGGPMAIDYKDQYGYPRSLSYPGGSDRVTLAFFLGDQKQTNAVNVTGVVPKHNWVGTYETPDRNPTNAQNWQALMNTKVAETMRESTSVPGGARYVDVIVLNGGNKQIVHQNTYTKGQYESALPYFNTSTPITPEVSGLSFGIRYDPIKRDCEIVDRRTGAIVNPENPQRRSVEAKDEVKLITTSLSPGEVAVIAANKVNGQGDGVFRILEADYGQQVTFFDWIKNGRVSIYKNRDDAIIGLCREIQDAATPYNNRPRNDILIPKGWQVN